MTDVFISYKREDRDKAHALAEAIAAEGYEVWWDVELLPGEKFADEIKSIIKSAKAAVVLWSERSVKSTFVAAEARMALRQGILIPAWLDRSEPPLPFSELHTLDLTNWGGDPADPILEPLILAIERKLGSKPDEAPSEPIGNILAKPEEEATYWRSISESPVQSIHEYQLYLNKFGRNSSFAELAQLRIEKLEIEKHSRWRRQWPAKVVSGATAVVLLITAIVNLWPDPREIYPFEVIAAPATARVEIIDSNLVYRPGMRLEEGTYRLQVSADGYETYEELLAHSKPRTSKSIVLAALTSDDAQKTNAGSELPTAVDLRRIGTIANGLLNLARPDDSTPLFIEFGVAPGSPIDVFESERKRDEMLHQVAFGLPDSQSNQFFSSLNFSSGTISDAVIEYIISKYKDRYNLELAAQTTLAGGSAKLLSPPKLEEISIKSRNGFPYGVPGKSQSRDDFSCSDPDGLLQFMVTLAESIMFYKSIVSRGYGNDDYFTANFGYASTHPNGDFVELDIGNATDLKLDAMLASGTLDHFSPLIYEIVDEFVPQWRTRIAKFFLDLLSYREHYQALVRQIGIDGIRETYLRKAVNNVPNPFGCTNTDQQHYRAQFGGGWGQYEVSSFYLLPSELGAPGVHQWAIVFWYRRSLAGTDEQMAELITPFTQMAMEVPVDMQRINLAVAAGSEPAD